MGAVKIFILPVLFSVLLGGCEEGSGVNITWKQKDKERDAHSSVSLDIDGKDIKLGSSSVETYISDGKRITVESGDSVKLSPEESSNPVNADWTPLFKSWEYGCGESQQLSDLFDSLDKTTSRGVKAPADYQYAVSNNIKSVVKEGYEGYLEYTTDISGKYYGIPVSKIGRYIGNGNGFRGNFLALAASENNVRQVLAQHKVVYRPQETDPNADPSMELPYPEWGQASINGQGPLETHITCDWSM